MRTSTSITTIAKALAAASANFGLSRNSRSYSCVSDCTCVRNAS